MRFLGPHSAGEGPHLVPNSLKMVSPSGPQAPKLPGLKIQEQHLGALPVPPYPNPSGIPSITQL